MEGIRLDSSYQRDLESVRVQKLLQIWDARLAGVLLLSARAGALWCVDGQHRLAVMRELGISHCEATVLDGLTQTEEAHLFVQRNRAGHGTKTLNAWDLFKAEMTAGHDEAINVNRITNSVGFRINRTAGHDHIGAVGALRRIYAIGGESLLRLTLDTVRQTWTGDRKALDGQMLEGLAVFFHSFREEPQYDQARTDRVLRDTAPVKFLRLAQEIAANRMAASASSTNVAEAMRNTYNSGLGAARKLGVIRRVKRSPARVSRS